MKTLATLLRKEIDNVDPKTKIDFPRSSLLSLCLSTFGTIAAVAVVVDESSRPWLLVVVLNELAIVYECLVVQVSLSSLFYSINQKYKALPRAESNLNWNTHY